MVLFFSDMIKIKNKRTLYKSNLMLKKFDAQILSIKETNLTVNMSYLTLKIRPLFSFTFYPFY